MANKTRLTSVDEVVDVSLLKEHPRNVRIHSSAQIEELAKSLKQFGQTRSVVVDENNFILVGHATVRAMNRIKMFKVKVLRMVGLSDRDKVKLMLADNKTQELGVNDYDQVNKLLRSLGEDFDIPGYSADDLRAVFVDLDKTANGFDKGTIDMADSNFFSAAKTESQLMRCPYCKKPFSSKDKINEGVHKHSG